MRINNAWPTINMDEVREAAELMGQAIQKNMHGFYGSMPAVMPEKLEVGPIAISPEPLAVGARRSAQDLLYQVPGYPARPAGAWPVFIVSEVRDKGGGEVSQKAIPWSGHRLDFVFGDAKRLCPFLIESSYGSSLTCTGDHVEGRGGPVVCAYYMTDRERGDVCKQFWHMLDVPLDLATNCCWDFQILVSKCVDWRTRDVKKVPYFSFRRCDWNEDVRRRYEQYTLKFCPFCGAEISYVPKKYGEDE